MNRTIVKKEIMIHREMYKMIKKFNLQEAQAKQFVKD